MVLETGGWIQVFNVSMHVLLQEALHVMARHANWVQVVPSRKLRNEPWSSFPMYVIIVAFGRLVSQPKDKHVFADKSWHKTNTSPSSFYILPPSSSPPSITSTRPFSSTVSALTPPERPPPP